MYGKNLAIAVCKYSPCDFVCDIDYVNDIDYAYDF